MSGQRITALLSRADSSDRALWCAVFFLLLALYLLTLRIDPLTMSPDTVSVTSSAWQLAHHGTPTLPADSGAFRAWLIPSGPNHVVSNREPGLVLLATPFYRLFGFAGIHNVVPASLAAALVTASAMATLALVFRRLVARRTALIAALITGTATTTWAVSGTSLWPHGPDQLYAAAAMLALACGANGWAGLAFAAAVVTRPPMAVAAAVTGIWATWKERSVRPALVIGLGSGLGVVALLLWAHRFWGGGLDSQYAGAGYDFVGPIYDVSVHAWSQFAGNIVGALISPGRGVLFGSPFLVVLLLGVRPAWRVAPPWVRSSAVGGALYLAVQLKANTFGFGGGATFWSYRYPIETLTFCAPLLLLAWREWVTHSARRRASFWALVVVSVSLQAAGALCFRRTATAWWSTNDIMACVRDSPWVSIPIFAAGYLSAAVVYRRVSDQSPSVADSSNDPAALPAG